MTAAADNIAAARERLLRALRPRVALVDLASCAMHYPGDVEMRVAVTPRVDHADFDAGQDAWRAATVATITALDTDPDIRALRQRLFDAGIGSAFASDQDDHALWASLVLSGPREALLALEALAADDAGITDPDARRTASERFLAYLLRNHHPDWQQNRARVADVGDSPYTPSEEWNLLGT